MQRRGQREEIAISRIQAKEQTESKYSQIIHFVNTTISESTEDEYSGTTPPPAGVEYEIKE